MSRVTQTTSQLWRLRDIIGEIVSHHPSTRAVYLFGSRARGTESRRSDIDILVHFANPVAARAISEWLHVRFPPIDLFKTIDMKVAESVINGSVIDGGKPGLVSSVNPVLLWENGSYSSDFKDWDQLTDSNVSYAMTIAGPALPRDYAEVIAQYSQILSIQGYPDTALSFDWATIGEKIGNIIGRSLDSPERFNSRAKCLTVSSLRIENEYDFQNWITLILDPWIPEIDPEPIEVIIGGKTKRADFAILGHRIVIEAKYISDASSCATVLKTLDGLTSFYLENPRISLLLFLILVEKSVPLDFGKFESRFSDSYGTPPVIVKFYSNERK